MITPGGRTCRRAVPRTGPPHQVYCPPRRRTKPEARICFDRAKAAAHVIEHGWHMGEIGMALRWLPDWLPKIEKGPECDPGTPSDLDLLVGTAGFEPATP